MLKLLITSAGSLVSQNILDALESRRSQCTVVGADANVESPRLYRCDKVYKVPPIDEPEPLSDAILSIIDNEKPHLVLAGRDHDTVFLSALQEKYSALSSIIPGGLSSVAMMMRDKWLTHLFAQKYSLPFASSFLYSSESDSEGLRDFVAAHGFPLVAKPRKGFGSLGIRFILNFDQLRALTNVGPALVQECLEPFVRCDGFMEDFALGVPLFFQVPERTHFSYQTIIGRDGTVSEGLSSFNRLLIGRCESCEKIADESVSTIGQNFARALFQEGWHGPVNLQIDKDKDGILKVFELNPRMTGATSARLYLGYDELGILAEMYCPDSDFPNLTKSLEPGDIQVVRSLTDYPVYRTDMEELTSNGVWQKKAK